MRFRYSTPRARLAAAVATVAVLAGTGIGIARASDHQDNPLVELNPAMDMTDVYAFPGSSPDRIALVLNSWAFLTPAQRPSTSFDPNLLYQFKIDNTGDAKEDKVIQIVFKGTGATQTVEVRGPVAAPVLGAMNNQIANVTPLTFTCTPPGTGVRLGLDRDGDGYADGDEILAHTNPADPSSHP